MKKVLLLNPPGKQVYIRDYYCSKVSKTNYVYHPVDLLMVSAQLYPKCELKGIDCIAEGVSVQECLRMIQNFGPDVIVFESGSVSWSEDCSFFAEVKRQCSKVVLVGSGDVFNENGVQVMREQGWLDAILLDFTTDDVVKFIGGEVPKNMIYRRGGEIVEAPVERSKWGVYDMPVPRHELFQRGMYRYPFIRKYPFATVLGDYGCAWRCNFCIMSQIGFKTRTVDSVLAELRYLKQLGVKEIYWDDQTFGANRKRAEELLTRMLAEGLDFGWVCFSRADVVTENSLALWKRAGCHTIMFGVESGVQEVLDAQKKDLTKGQIRAAFVLCRKQGIRTLGTFILGLPDDTYDTCRETIQFAKELGCDYAAFNVLVPRMGTQVRKESIEKGNVDAKVREMDQSGSFVVMGNKSLTPELLHELHKTAIREFYCRPGYIFRRLKDVRTFDDMKGHAVDALSLFKKFVTT